MNTVNQYIWDLGIDWNNVEEQGTFPLAAGFMAFDGSSIIQQAPFGLQENVPMEFNIYDITDNPKTQSIIIVGLAFASADIHQSPTSPFVTNVLFAGGVTSPGTEFSTPFQGTFPVFPAGISEVIVNPGRFLMSVVVVAQSTDGVTRKAWFIDPVMNVDGPTGPLPDPQRPPAEP